MSLGDELCGRHIALLQLVFDELARGVEDDVEAEDAGAVELGLGHGVWGVPCPFELPGCEDVFERLRRHGRGPRLPRAALCVARATGGLV